jgi:3-hydroxyisobutyrate dehydrogenase-like beta-hydroxyacid dehydrogenase
MAEKQRVGFIGLGYMGHGMAKNLLEKGHPLVIKGNRNRQPVDDLVGRGAKELAAPKDIAASADIVFLCLPGSPDVEAAVRGADGLKAGAHEGLVIVDTTTANPNSTIALAAELKPLGVRFVDAPLGRTPKEAQAGELDTMVGADPDTFAELKPVIECWAKRILHVGPVGAGHMMKLLMNFLALGYAALYSEAMTIGSKTGISKETFNGVISGSRMDCGFYQTFMKYVIERDENAHLFSLRNAHKDLRYLNAVANEAGIASYLAAAVKNPYAHAEATGQGDKNVPQISDIIAAMSGVKLHG